MWSHAPFLQWHPLHLIHFTMAISHLRPNIFCTLGEWKGCTLKTAHYSLHEATFLKTTPTLHFTLCHFQIGLTSKKYEKLKILLEAVA